jgi:integrase
VTLARPLASTDLSPQLTATAESAAGYAAASKAPRTRATYAGEWKGFVAWALGAGLVALPAEGPTVALYLAALADRGRRPAGIEVALAAIVQAHRLAGHGSPREHVAVREVRAGIRRTLGVAPKQAAPLVAADLCLAVAALPATLLGVRDRALLLLGWAGGLRRSELVALDADDVRETADGIEVHLRRSKTDQEGEGRRVGVPWGSSPASCPVRAVRAWREAAEVDAGPLFVGLTRHGKLTGNRLDGREVARIVQRSAAAAGLDAAELSGHSLRAGLATSAARAGKSERSIMRQTGHRSVTTVRKYIRDAEMFVDNAAGGLL